MEPFSPFVDLALFSIVHLGLSMIRTEISIKVGYPATIDLLADSVVLLVTILVTVGIIWLFYGI